MPSPIATTLSSEIFFFGFVFLSFQFSQLQMNVWITEVGPSFSDYLRMKAERQGRYVEVRLVQQKQSSGVFKKRYSVGGCSYREPGEPSGACGWPIRLCHQRHPAF